MSSQYILRTILEQNGLINLFSIAFSTLLYVRTRRGFIEKLLLITSYSSFIADTLLIFTDGPTNITIKNTKSVRIMTFFEVIFWTIREVGLTLYTNKLIKILDYQRTEKIYYFVYKLIFILICIWRTFDMCLRTYNRQSNIIIIGNLVYLGVLSVIDIWSSFYLIKTSSKVLKTLNSQYNSYKLIKEIIYSGILRIIFINFIPLIRLIVDLTVSSVFNYENDVSIIVYSIQVSMNLMYLIDISIIKIEGDNIFRKANGHTF
jgi:hypothetical protein